MIDQEVSRFIESGGGGPWRIIWAAGVGRVGAPAEALESEMQALIGLSNAVTRVPDKARAGQVVLASSAGALYGRHGSGIIRDDTPPCPLDTYGIMKVDQEDLLRQLGDLGTSVVLCRFANVFGLRGRGALGGGLVCAGIRAAFDRKALQVYVNIDTRRDYVYNLDSARLALEVADRAGPGVTTRLVCSGRTMSVAEVLETVRRVMRRRVPVVYGSRRETALQPRTLSLRSCTQVPLTPFACAISATAIGTRHLGN